MKTAVDLQTHVSSLTKRGLLICALVALNTVANAEGINAIFPKGEGRNQASSYTYQLLDLALKKSGQPYQLRLTDYTMPEARARELVSRNSKAVTVVFSGTSKQFEEQLLPVRIPAYGGLLGFRLFLIHQHDAPRFSKIRTVQDLRTLVSGQGSNWSDVEILRKAGLTVHTTKYPLLFALLDKQRIDYFPRGASEIYEEYDRYKANNPNLAIEQALVMVYPFASFFFVSKDNQALHDAIYQGLARAHADGSFLQFFQSHPTTANVLAKAKLNQRHRINIDNPLMTNETLAIDQNYWFNANWQ